MLSVGSVVYLKNGSIKMVVLGNCPVREGKYYDYLAGEFPVGMSPEKIYFFNEENIEEVLFEGYQDETSKRYLAAIENWKKEFDIPKGDVIEDIRDQQQKMVDSQKDEKKTILDDLFN